MMKFEDAISVFSSFDIKVTNVDSLKKAYRKMALLIHPDKQNESNETVDMVTLNEAWRVLKEDSQRAVSQLMKRGYKDPYSSDPLSWTHLPSLLPLDELLNEAFNMIRKDELSTIDDVIFSDRSHRSRKMFFEKEQLKATTSFHDSLVIQDISSAMERGSVVCSRYTVRAGFHSDRADVWNFIHSIGKAQSGTDNIKLTDLWAWLESLTFDVNSYGSYESRKFEFNGDTIEVFKSDDKAAHVFSPYRLNKLKRLKSLPAKPTISHLMKALANGQYRNLKVDFYLTDDYVLDSQRDFCKGMVGNPFSLVESMVESGGTKVYSNGRYDGMDSSWSFGNHSNDSKSVQIVINNDFPTESLADEKTKIEDTKKIA